MTEAIVYLEPDRSHQLKLMLQANGYVPQINLRGSLTHYVNRLLEVPLSTAPTLVSNPCKHYSANKHSLEIPESCYYIPRDQFNLGSWSDFIYNLILGNIYPTHSDSLGQVPYSELSSIKVPPLPDIPDTIHIQQTTDVELEGIAFPLRHPDYYMDNRPDVPFIKGPTSNRKYHWYLVDLPRTSRHIIISTQDYNAAIAISEYFNIVPIKRYTPNVAVTLVLEALYHKLLIPRT